METCLFECQNDVPDHDWKGVAYEQEGTKIKATREEVLKEMEKGYHSESKRPIAALLNHCALIESSAEMQKIYDEFMKGAEDAIEPNLTSFDAEKAEQARAEKAGIEAENAKAELAELRAKAKSLGIPGYQNMKAETLKVKIEAAEKE